MMKKSSFLIVLVMLLILVAQFLAHAEQTASTAPEIGTNCGNAGGSPFGAADISTVGSTSPAQQVGSAFIQQLGTVFENTVAQQQNLSTIAAASVTQRVQMLLNILPDD
jgi:hypothetical protein